MSSTNGSSMDIGRGAVVITGASTGIGEASALRLDRAGYTVFAGVRRDDDAQKLRAHGSARLHPIMLDVTDQSSIDGARRDVTAALGASGLAGLVNNAGIGIGGPIEFVALDDWRRQFEVNLFGTIAVTQAFLPLIRQARGRIAIVGSIGGRMASPFIAPYCATKFALEAVGDALRFELKPWGIEVAIIEPGDIATPIWDKAQDEATRVEQAMTVEARELYGNAIGALRTFVEEAPKRGIPPDRVARAVHHALASKRPKTRYLVGTDAHVQAIASTVLPDRMLDRLIASQLKVGKNSSAPAEADVVSSRS